MGYQCRVDLVDVLVGDEITLADRLTGSAGRDMLGWSVTARYTDNEHRESSESVLCFGNKFLAYVWLTAHVAR